MPRLPIAELISAISKTPVEREVAKTAEQLAKEAPEIAQHLPGVPYAGTEALKPFVRATRAPKGGDVGALVQKTKRALGGFVQAEPNLPKHYQDMFLEARYKVESATSRADKTVLDRVASKLEGDPASQARLMSDYLTLADEFSDLQSRFSKDPTTPVYGRGGATIDEIERELQAVMGEMRKNPGAVQAAQGFRAVADELFNDMVRYGLIAPNRYRKDWTPRQQIMEIARGMSEAYGPESVGGEVLSIMERRTQTGGVTETNMISVLRKVLREFHEKVAGDDLVLRILSDPALNRTDEFAARPGALLPKGWALYRPRPGLPGWRIPEAEAHVAAGVADALGADARTLVPGSFVLPEDIVGRLENFYPPPVQRGAEETAYKAGRMMARAFTVYNPANTALNLVSDFSVAALGLPGERANLGGFLRFYPGAFLESVRGAFGRGSEVFDRAVQEGITSATFERATGGENIPTALKAALGAETSRNPFGHLANVARRARLAVESAPRIAAGLAAEQRVINEAAARGRFGALTRQEAAAEFGRVGRAITLPFGAGAPEHTRSPFFRFAAPFVQFIGLATDRTVKLLSLPGSRGRAWAAVIAVPTAAFMWNRQNEAFRDVEMALHQRDRYSMHVIAPDPEDPSVPMKDRNGKPVVLRFRYFVPEEVASMFGLSNLPTRAADVLEGRSTLGEQVAISGAQTVESVGRQVVPAQIVAELASGRSLLTGEEKPRAELLTRSIPIVRELQEGYKGAANAGPLEGVKRVVQETAGIRFATPAKKGRADADILELKFKLRDARSKMRSAYRRGDRVEGERWRDEIYKIANRIRAINASRRKSRTK